MSLATYALTDLEGVLDLLAVSSHPQPQLIEAMINTASEQIIEYAGREFKPLTTDTTRTFPITATGRVYFAPSEPRIITDVQANVESASPTTLDTSQYQTDAWGDGGGYSGLLLLTNYYYANPSPGGTGLYNRVGSWGYRLPESRVSVTGTWGWESVPATVEWQCRWQVKQWVRAELEARSEILASVDESPSAAYPSPSLHPRVKSVLDRYREPVVA